MAKKRRGSALGTAALLGGAALLASRMMKGKGDKEGKKDMDTTADASAGMAKDRLGGIGLDRGDMDTSGDASAGMARDRLADLEKAGVRSPSRAAATRAAVSPRASEVPPPMSTTSPASMTGKERASEMARIQARGGRDRLGESAAGRMIQRGLNRFGSGSNEVGGEGMVGDVVGAKRGGSIKAKAKAKPKMSSASKRADGCVMKGKTRGRMV